MKKLLALTLVLAMVVCAFAGCAPAAAEKTETPAADKEEAAPEATGNKEVVIGVFEPASGDNGAGGKQEMLGMQYANDMAPTVEIGGETYDVKLVYADNQSSTDKAVSAASELVSKGASVVLGSYGSGVAIAGSDTFKNAGVPAIGVTCTNPQVTEGNDHYFRICFIDPFQGTVLANFAQEKFDAKTAYVLTKLGDDYSKGLGYYFTEAFEAAGGTVIAEEFPDGNSDFTSYLTNAKNAGAEVLFAPTSTEAAALIIEQSSTQGLNVPMLGGDTWDSNVILNAAEGKDVQIYVSTFYQEGGTPDFDSGIKEWINADQTNLDNNGGDDTVAAVTAMGYDAYNFALEALKAAGSTEPAAVKEALWKTTLAGVTGQIEIDPEAEGDAIRNTAFVKVANTTDGTWALETEHTIAG